MKNTIDAYPATLAAALGINAKALAEIGGFSDRYARDILAGKANCPADTLEALQLIQDDIDVMTDSFIADVTEGAPSIGIYGSNDLLRANTNIPARGQAAGGFASTMKIAAITARDALKEDGIDVDIFFKQ